MGTDYQLLPLPSGADAIHPGFGFLSENEKFVKMCEQCKITFIGPGSEVIGKMGNKSQARNTMVAQQMFPSFLEVMHSVFNAEEGFLVAQKVGFPVIIKASLGGGGKGMRVAQKEEEFKQAFQTAQKETQMAFGDDSMYIERFVVNPKHIEFQILADSFGNVIHLGEAGLLHSKKSSKDDRGSSLHENLRRT